MSFFYDYGRKNQRNNYNNYLPEKKNTPSQFNSVGKMVSTPINYHYLQKQKQNLSESNIQNSFRNSNQNNYNTNNLYYQDKPADTNSNNNPIKLNENQNSNNYFNNNKSPEINENKFSPFYSPAKIETADKNNNPKNLNEDLDKKLYDTMSNFNPNSIKNNKTPSQQNEIPNYNRRGYSYNKYQNSNNVKSSIYDSNQIYKNYFQNNNNNNFHYNINTFHNREDRNSMENIHQISSIPNKTNNLKPEEGNYTISNYGSYSLAGSDAFRRPKTNQDSFYIREEKINNLLNNYTFGVFDGHGLEGHLVSQAIKQYLNYNTTYSDFSNNSKIHTFFQNLSKNINNSTSFNAMESGSTVVITHVTQDKIICVNCGDSRAILISDNKVLAISRDHKPELPDEKIRILNSGGRVDKIYGMGPFRVWFKNADYPGLAMSRSIGDGYAHRVGVSDVPEITEYDLKEYKPLAIVLASDGVFEFVSNEDVKNIVSKYLYGNNKNKMNATSCAREIVEYSRRVWENSGYAIDDITCVVAFFNHS